MSKISWLDKFAEEQSKKMNKTASLNKCAEQVIIDPEDVPGVVDGQQITYKNEMYKVLNASFEDEMGPGVVLEKIAEFSDEVLPEEMSMEMGSSTVTDTQKCTVAPEKAVQPDQGNNGLHIEVRDTVEVDKFNQEAIETESQIAQENAIDRTVPEGKYNRIEVRLQNMVPMISEVSTEEDSDIKVEDDSSKDSDSDIEVEDDSSKDSDSDIKVEDNFSEDSDIEVEDGFSEDSNTEIEDDSSEENKTIVSNRILNKILSSNK